MENLQTSLNGQSQDEPKKIVHSKSGRDSRSRNRPLNERERIFADELAKGTNFYQAAKIAGYGEATCNKARILLLPRVQKPLIEELESRLPMAKLANRLIEGLDAIDTKFFAHEGQVIDQKDVVYWTERRRYAETLARILGALNETPQTNVQVVLDL